VSWARPRGWGIARHAAWAVTVLAAYLSIGGVAHAQDPTFGEGFGFALINQDPPALPDVKHAFWVGTCDRASAPGLGVSIPKPGIGKRPSTIQVPADNGAYSFITVAAPLVPPHCVDWGKEANYPGAALWATPPAWRLPAVTQAGGHPDATAMFHLARNQSANPLFSGAVDGAVDNVIVRLPAGFVGDPTAIAKCTAEQFSVKPLQCPPESQVGLLTIRIETAAGLTGNLGNTEVAYHPVYNLEPRHGKLAEFGVAYLSSERATTARIVAKARTHDDFGVSAFVMQVPAVLPMLSQQITLWGVPWAASNDSWRAPTGTPRIPPQGYAAGKGVSYQPAWGDIRAFISNPTECTGGALETSVAADAYERPGVFDSEGFPDLTDPASWATAVAPAPAVSGCEKPGFDPTLALSGSSMADAPSGMSVDLALPANDDPPTPVAQNPSATSGAPAHWRSDAGVSTAQMRSTQVSMPEGWSVNPSGAAGLEACSDSQIGMIADGAPPRFNRDDPFDGAGAECPLASRIGTAEIDTPLLDDPIAGELVLGEPRSTDPQSADMFRLFVVARSPQRGLVAKVAGHATASAATGQLTATFAESPRVPMEGIHLEIKGGQRSMLATPRACTTGSWLAEFSPWTAAHDAGGSNVSDQGSLLVDSRCANGFAPALTAAVSPRTAGGHGTFALRFSREDGEQWLSAASVTLPKGLLAAVGRVPLCSSAEAAANACPEASRIGTVDAGAGAGDPFFLERKGSAYLTESYKGAPYGMAVSIPVEAGPFRGAHALSPIVVRQALRVDPTTAQATAESDPFPIVHHGIPLRARVVKVVIDRGNFVVNPTGCARKEITARFVSVDGAAASVATPFYATGCRALPFRPGMRLRLTGRRQTRSGGHPGVRATVRQSAGQAGIARAEVRLPKTLALDPDNARGLCEFVDGTKPDLENHCPHRSVIGRGSAVSPLLKRPLTGDVYFVKNVRIDPETGASIRTLPMIVVALRGEIAINLRGESSVSKGKLVSTFANVPDAPISNFKLRLAGGSGGILVVTESARGKINLCRRRQVAISLIDAHNGRRRDTATKIATPCRRSLRKRARRR
jgi:hypothetical protein